MSGFKIPSVLGRSVEYGEHSFISGNAVKLRSAVAA